jgi:hypothetical protein
MKRGIEDFWKDIVWTEEQNDNIQLAQMKSGPRIKCQWKSRSKFICVSEPIKRVAFTGNSHIPNHHFSVNSDFLGSVWGFWGEGI